MHLKFQQNWSMFCSCNLINTDAINCSCYICVLFFALYEGDEKSIGEMT